MFEPCLECGAKSFEAFLRDMGERPPGTTIDRRDNDKGYFKDNCRWATATEQHHNRRPFVVARRCVLRDLDDQPIAMKDVAHQLAMTMKVYQAGFRKRHPLHA